jgi:predicted ATPase/DNA-binding SARP family transcriptional activator
VIVGLLGPLEVEGDGRRVGGGRLRALLARLALDAGRPVTVGRLVDAVWEDELPADETHALQSLVSRLRRALGDGRLAAAPGGYVLHAEVDAQRFEALAAEGHAALGDPERAARPLGDALGLWRGPALADLADYRFAVAEAARLEDLRLAAAADRAQAELALGRGARLVGELEALTAEHPLHERLAAQHIAALSAAGRQADALAAYERIRVRLSDELGVPPSAELQAAHLAVLRGERAQAPAPTRTRTNLPAEVTSFVGRAAEIATIASRLERGRLVTLVGPGGAGKTRLSREAVAGWVDRVADGVWLVELAPVTAEVEIVPAILGALGVREPAVSDRPLAPRDSLERLLDALDDREAILVLDNCEHLIAEVAALAERLLAACPRLRILATSREALAIAGESIVAVPPLASEPAVELFADRALAADPDFVVDDAAREICRRLDGLPLALELAAARLRALPAAELAARLDDRFRLLTGGSRTALPRHRTLRAVVDWSWDLLCDDERRLARRLAVFSAGATVESAAAVGGDFDGLAALVDRSLLQIVPGTTPVRYRMLETIREYGLERLEEAGELAATRDAHARHFAQLVDIAEPRLRRPGQKRWFALLQAERENILAGLRWLGDRGDARCALHLAVALMWFWLLSGSQKEAEAWLDFALAVEGEADPVDRGIAAGLREVGALSDAGDGERMKERLTALSHELEAFDDTDRPLLAVAKPILALFAGDQERATRLEAAAREHPDPWVDAALHLLNAGRSENEGEIEAMGDELATARAKFAAIGDAWGLAMALFIDSGRHLVSGRLDAARAALDEGKQALDGLDTDVGGGMLDVRMADIRLRQGDLAGARELALGALSRRDVGGDDAVFVEAMVARIDWLSGDLPGARARVDEARERIARRGRVLPQYAHAQAVLEALSALLAVEAGELDEAERRLAAAYPAALGTTDMPIVATAGVAAAALAAARGCPEEAAELLGAAAAVRGAEDFTSPEVARLRDDAHAAAYARGRALSREAALERLAAVASSPAPVGP